jgi:DNA segregation ATPase FtsK/SpoIIIE-like protein
VARVKNIQEWNRRPDLGGRLPYVLLVIDELAEVSVEEAGNSEEKRQRQEALALLARMARLGRAFGFHVIAATQRPAVETVPGPIKSQLLARICFKVASGTESRVVLGEDNSSGAELPAHRGRGSQRSRSAGGGRRYRVASCDSHRPGASRRGSRVSAAACARGGVWRRRQPLGSDQRLHRGSSVPGV